MNEQKYSNIKVIRLAQCMFGFALPKLPIEKRSNKFYTGNSCCQTTQCFSYLI